VKAKIYRAHKTQDVPANMGTPQDRNKQSPEALWTCCQAKRNSNCVGDASTF
jgi:hypothetical protein